ncbi:MAG: TonB-dependent receptor domain-containing protein, partial [Blastocatellia bacterium]
MPRNLSSSGLSRKALTVVFAALLGLGSAVPINAQDTVTGAFEGFVTDSKNGNVIARASVQIINQSTQVPVAKRTDTQGRFYQGLLQPGLYAIRVTADGYQVKVVEQRLLATKENAIQPLPIKLDPEEPPPPSTATPTEPGPTPTTEESKPKPTPPIPERKWSLLGDVAQIVAEISAANGRRGAYTEAEVSALPIGASTLVRSFDELSFRLPGVALPPHTLGGTSGPGVGSGVGSAGQFSVNGLRSRANNFTVDGSDNNDEDIGVRRQGFFSLVPQPIESIKEYQVITHLAPAQFGRNFGAQVNAVSKSGGSQPHGALYGFLNTSDLNARDFFDTTNGNAVGQLFAGQNQPVLLDGQPLTVRNGSGGKDSSTFGKVGFNIGGPLSRLDNGSGRSAFYFLSAEGQLLNASKEVSFAVPTVEERGFGRTGATGIFRTPLPSLNPRFPIGSDNAFFPTTADADSIFSLFPFANNPRGVYGANTFTQTLPASAQGKIVSGKVDGNFKLFDRQQSVVARYNLTDDWRTLPATGGAIFSALRPRVRTQNFSAFLNSELSGPQSARPIFNQLRFSYGRTRLVFDEERNLALGGVPDGIFRLPSQLLPDEQFLLNALEIGNFTLPADFGVANRGPVLFQSTGRTTEDRLGPIGQVNIAGFSPVGVDVLNFPQRRTNNTYQLADTLTLRTGDHSFAFGADMRRTELNSDLPRNARPLITFAGAPRLLFDFDPVTRSATNFRLGNDFIPGVDLAAASAASGFQQTLATGPSDIALRYYQLNFFAQDEWRLLPNLSLSAGLRYEYNTPPRERRRRIENTFNSQDLSAVPDLSRFIAGRRRIFETDQNDFAPRVAVAYSPNFFGPDRATVIRGGYGLFYDQILGAVVSQSRNVFPTFLTVNLAGGGFGRQFGEFLLANPNAFARLGTLNSLERGDPPVALADVVRLLNQFATGDPSESVFGATLPARRLRTPMAHHYSFSIEQQLGSNLVASAAYVGTLGRNLLRFTTPNLGPNEFLLPLAINADSFTPDIFGFALAPGTRLTPNGDFVGGRPLTGVGSVNIFETTARSRYDSLQLQLRGRLRT